MGNKSEDKCNVLYLFSTMNGKNKPTPEENEEAHNMLKDYFGAAGIQFVELEGSYKGGKELSFLIPANTVPEEAVQVYCKHGQQEAYLVLEGHRDGMYKAIMTDVESGAKTFLGYMRSMSKENIDALGLDYTYRPDLNMYWTIWPTDTTLLIDFEYEIAEAIATKG